MGNRIYSTIETLIKKAIGEKIFPGAAVGIVEKIDTIKKHYYFTFGNTDYNKNIPVTTETFYDLASLTKPLTTTLAILALLNSQSIFLSNKLSLLLECEVPDEKKDISLFHLLNHSAGLAAHLPLYARVGFDSDYEKINEVLKKIILDEPLKSEIGKEQVYSDIGFILLGMVVAVKSRLSLSDFVKKKILQPMGVEKRVFFNTISGKSNSLTPTSNKVARVYAPTGQCLWRKSVRIGEVHDDNAYAMGGVAGHAGLFGSLTGVVDCVDFLLDVVQGRRKHPQIDSSDLRLAVTRQNEKGCWGLGFDTPSPMGSSSGRYLSRHSFGHLGFTGTSFWVDVEKDIAMVLLTNRVYPDPSNSAIKSFRPIFHDTLLELLGWG